MRKSGLPLVGDLAWGTHFCLFFEARNDLLDVFVPFIRAGLENDELCVWVVSPPLGPRQAIEALRAQVPQFESYRQRGRIEILSRSKWLARDTKVRRAVVAKLDEAVTAGLQGLRLASNGPGAASDGITDRLGLDAVAGSEAIAAFAYPRDRFDAVGLMDVVKEHRFALLKNAGRWEVIESAEARPVKDALRRTEEKLQFLFRNMSEGFAYHRIVLDKRGTPRDYVFLEVNEAFERQTGLKGKDIVGRTARQVIPGIEKDPTDWIGVYGRIALTGEPAHFESYAEALRRWYAISAFCPQHGYFAVTFSDITERKSSEQRITSLNETLRRNVEELSAANQELEAFTHTVSHDLRAPLRNAGGYIQLIEARYGDRLDETGRRYLQAAARSARDMERLIDDLLAFSQTGRVRMSPQRLDSELLVGQVIQALGTERRAERLSLQVGSLPKVFGDPSLLHLVWANLIANALKFTRLKDPAVIEIGASDGETEHVFSVKDNGVGFDMRHAGKLFSLFQRLHRADEFEGTGVGLANVARIVQRHGGRVWAEGERGVGATFFFTLPKEPERA